MWKLRHQVSGQQPETRSFLDWGLSTPTLTFLNQGRDRAVFHALGRSVDAVELFQTGESGINHSVTILRGETPVFVGTITESPRNGDGGREDNRFTVAGPWWLLEELVYEIAWTYWNGSALATNHNSHLILGQAANGGYQTNAQVVADVMSFAAPVILDSTGIAISSDLSAFDGVAFPVAEARDISCAEAIRKVLRYSPDAKLWWDYSTGAPKMKIARRGSLEKVSIPVPGKVKSLDISPRLDLLRPVVILDYEISTVVNGVSYTGHVIDKWPANGPDRAVRAYKSTINLQGASVLQAFVETRPIQPTTEDWWKDREAWLSDPTVTQFTPPPAVTRKSNLPNELVQGQLADWMRHSNGAPISAEPDTVVGTGNVSQNGGVQEKVFSSNIIATDAETGLYSIVQQYAEAVPQGLAKHFFEAVNKLHWQGSLVIVEDEWTGLVGLQNVLNVNGGRQEWQTMDAFVWEVVVDIGAGQTTVSFGPSENLGPADLSDIARASRNRLLSLNPAVRITGQQAGSFALGRTVANTSSNSGPSTHKVFVVKDTNPQNPGGVVIDSSECQGREIRVREYDVCVDNVVKKVLLVGSEPF